MRNGTQCWGRREKNKRTTNFYFGHVYRVSTGLPSSSLRQNPVPVTLRAHLLRMEGRVEAELSTVERRLGTTYKSGLPGASGLENNECGRFSAFLRCQQFDATNGQTPDNLTLAGCQNAPEGNATAASSRCMPQPMRGAGCIPLPDESCKTSCEARQGIVVRGASHLAQLARRSGVQPARQAMQGKASSAAGTNDRFRGVCARCSSVANHASTTRERHAGANSKRPGSADTRDSSMRSSASFSGKLKRTQAAKLDDGGWKSLPIQLLGARAAPLMVRPGRACTSDMHSLMSKKSCLYKAQLDADRSPEAEQSS